MSLFDEENLMGGPSSGSPEYGSPDRIFEGYTAPKPPNPAELKFKQYGALQQKSKIDKENYQNSEEIFRGHEKSHIDFANKYSKVLYEGITDLPAEGKDYEELMPLIEQELQNRKNVDDEDLRKKYEGDFKKYSNFKKQFDRSYSNLKQYEGNYLNDRQIHFDNLTIKNQTPAAFKIAFDNWKTTSGGRRPNGSSSSYLDPKKANELLDFLNFDEPEYPDLAARPGGLKDVDPRYEFKGTLIDKQLNRRQLERRKQLISEGIQGLFGQHREYEKFKGAGYIGSPTFMNNVGGQSRMLTRDEREDRFIRKAKDAGITTLRDPDTDELIDVSNYTSQYSDEEAEAIDLMDKLGKVNAELAQKDIQFWSGLKSLKDKGNSEAWNEIEQLTQLRDELGKQLESMGFGGEVMKRAESIKDVGMLKGWAQAGWYQQEIADFSDNLIGGADNMTQEDFSAISELARDQQILQEEMAKNGDSPLAALMKKSQEEQDSWFEALGRFFGSSDGYTAMAELVVTNLTGFLPEYFDTGKYTIPAGAIAGGAVTSFTGIGMVPGAIAGAGKAAKANWAVTSASMEYAASILEFLQEEGVDVHNPKVFAAAWANDAIRGEIQKKAAKRTGFVALMDAVSAGMAGKVMPILKTPTVIKKLPGSMRMKNQNLGKLSVEETQELSKLNKAKKSFQRGSKESSRLEELTSKAGPSPKLDNAFSRALRESDARVNRTTFLHRARNASAELAFGGATGGAGELGAQFLTKEPGEDVDKMSVVSEIIGEVAGMGGIGAVYEASKAIDLRTKSGVVESVSNLDPNTGTGGGTIEEVNNNGWKFSRNYFEQSQDAVDFLAKSADLEPEITDAKGKRVTNPQILFLNDFIGGIHGIMARKGLRVKYVISDRTPEGKNFGGFQQREGQDYVVYLNPTALKARGDTIISGLLHELPHVVGTGFYKDGQVMRWYDSLSDNQRKQAFAHYYFKDKEGRPGQTLAHVGVAEIERILKNQNRVKEYSDFEKAFERSQETPANKAVAAQEWFSFEFARVLAGQIQDANKARLKKVTDRSTGQEVESLTSLPAGEAADILAFIDKYIYPRYSKYIGSAAMESAARVVPESIEARGQGEVGVTERQRAEGISSVTGADTARPGKMGPDEMYATILYDMGWHSGAGGKLSYIGETKNNEVGEKPVLRSMFENANKTIGDDRTVNQLLSIIESSPTLKSRVKLKPEDRRYSAEDPDADIFDVSEAEGLQTSAEEIRTIVRGKLDKGPDFQSLPQSSKGLSFMDKEGRVQEGKTKVTDLSESNRKRARAKALRKINQDPLSEDEKTGLKSNLPQGDKIVQSFLRDKGKSKPGKYQRVAQGLNKIRQLREASPDGSIIFEGVEYSPKYAQQLETQFAVFKKSLDDMADRVAEKEMDALKGPYKRTGEGSFGPAVFDQGKPTQTADTIKKPVPTKEERNLRMDEDAEGLARAFKGRTGKDLAQAVNNFDELISSEKELIKKIQPIINDLQKSGTPATDAKVYSELVDREGFSILANFNLDQALSTISADAFSDPESAKEAMVALDEEMKARMSRLEERISEIDMSISAEGKLQKTLKEGVETPKSEEGVLSTNQVKQTLKSLGNVISNFTEDDDSLVGTRKKQLEEFIKKNIRTSTEEGDTFVSDLADYLGAPSIDSSGNKSTNISPIRKLDLLLKDLDEFTPNDTISDIKKAQSDSGILGRIRGGVVKRIVSSETTQKVQKSQDKVDRLKKKKDQLQTFKTAVTLGNLSSNIDFRKVPALVNFVPDNKMEKGQDMSQLVTPDGDNVTLGDLAANDSLKVKLRNDPSGKEFKVNGKKILDKMYSNFDWENLTERQKNKFLEDTGMSWSDYSTRVILALATRREGAVIQTKRGPMPTSFFQLDVGANKFAILFERLNRLARKAGKDLGMQELQTTLSEQEALVRRARAQDETVIGINNKKKDFYDALYGPDKEGNYLQAVEDKQGNFLKWNKEPKGLSKDISKLLKTKKYKDHKDNLPNVNQGEAARLIPVMGQIEEAVKKLKGPKLRKKVTVQQVMDELGIGPRAIERANIQAKSRTINLLPRDLINIDLTAGRVAEEMFAEDTSTIGQTRFDYLNTYVTLKAEQDLVEDAELLKAILSSGRVPKKRFALGLYIKKGELFTEGRNLYRAKQNFTVTEGTNLNKVANPAESVSRADKDSTKALTKREILEIEVTLKRVEEGIKKLKSLTGEEYFPSDALANRPTVMDMTGRVVDVDQISDAENYTLAKIRGGESGDDVITSISLATEQYKHILMNMHETIAEQGTVADKGSFMQKMPTKSKGQSHMEHYHAEMVKSTDQMNRIRDEGLADMFNTNIEVARDLSKRIIASGKLKDQNKNFAPIDLQGLDKQYDLGRMFLQAMADGDFRVRNLIEVTDKKGRRISDLKKIRSNPYLNEQYESQIRDIQNLLKRYNLNFTDTFGFREDPQLSAIGLDDRSHSYVRDILEDITKKEQIGETEVKAVKLNQADITKIWESLGKTQSEKAFIRENFLSDGEGATVYWNPQAEKMIEVNMAKSMEMDDKLTRLHEMVRESDMEGMMFTKGESIYLNGSRYDVKSDLSFEDQEAIDITAILKDKGQINSQKGAIQIIFNENPEIFKRTESPRNTPEPVDFKDRSNSYVKNYLNNLQESIDTLEKSDTERSLRGATKIKEHRDAIKAFIEKGTKASDFVKELYIDGVAVKAKVKKDGKRFFLQLAESGNFVNKDGKVLSDKVSDVLFTQVEVKHRLKKDPGDVAALKKQAFSSFSTSPRQSISMLADGGGVADLGRLAGMMRKFGGNKETSGGTELIPFLDKLPLKMLDDLEGKGVDAIIGKLNNDLNEIRSNDKNDPRIPNIESEINLYNAIKESPLKLRDVPILLYISKFRVEELGRRPLTKDQALSDKDKSKIDSMISSKDEKSLVLALSSRLPGVRNNSIIKVGDTAAETDVDTGRVVKKSQPVYARVTINEAHLTENNTQKSVSFNQYSEDGQVDANLEDRWPKEKLKREDVEKDPKKEAFVYQLEMVYSENEVKKAFYESERDNLLKYAERDKKALAQISDMREALEKLSYSSDSQAKEDFAKQFKNYQKIGYLKETDPDLFGRLMKDIVEGDQLLQANWKMVARVVKDMDGLYLTDYEEVIRAQEQADKQAAEDYAEDRENFDPDDENDPDPKSPGEGGNPSVGQGSRQAASRNSVWESDGVFDRNDENDVGSSQNMGVEDEKDGEDVTSSQGLSMQFSPQGFFRDRPKNFINQAVKALTNKFRIFQDKLVRKVYPDEFDKDSPVDGTSWVSSHKGLYGRFVEQFGPFIKATKAANKALNLKESDKNHMRIVDNFYQGMGKAGDLLDEGKREFVNPITDALHETGVKMNDVGWYLYALVAPQANRAVELNRKRAGLELTDKEGNPINSGITNEEAQDIITALEEDQKMQDFISHRNNPIKALFDMHGRSLDLLKKSDLLTEQEYGAMKKAAEEVVSFKHNPKLGKLNFGANRRLPLKGFLKEDQDYAAAEDINDILGNSGSTAGKGFDQPRGAISLPALGRDSVTALADVDAIFAQTVRDYEQAVIRSSRAESSKAIFDLYTDLQIAASEGNQNAEGLFKRLFDPELKKLTTKTRNVEIDNKVIYQIKQIEVPTEIKDSKRALFLRDRGVPTVIMFADTDEGTALAAAAKNLTYEQLGAAMKVLNMGTKYMSRMATSWNPGFWFKNPIRDMTTAWFNLGGSKTTKAIRNQVASPLKFLSHATGIINYERNIDKFGKAPSNFDTMEESTLLTLAKTDIRAAYHVLKKQGGKTSFYKFKNLSEVLQEMETMAKEGRRSNVKKKISFLADSVDMLNTSLENVLRARVIMEGLKQNIPLDTLVTEARNVTVDFNKRGTMSQQLGTFIMFANPGIQGNRRFLESLAGRGLRASMGIGFNLFLLSYGWGLLSRALTGREEDEEDDKSTYFDDIPAQQRYTSLNISSKLFGDERKNPSHLSLPIGYGPHIFWALGDYLSKLTANGGKTIVEDSLNLSRILYATTSPVPLSLNPFPVAGPLYDLKKNRNWAGNPIYPEIPGADKTSPEAITKNSTPEIYNQMSTVFNRMLGGDETTPGSVRTLFGLNDYLEYTGEANYTLDGKFSGAGFEFVINEYAPLFGEVLNMANIYNLNAKDMRNFANSIPGLGGILKVKTPNYATLGRYYDLRDRAIAAKAKLKNLGIKEGAEFRRKNPHYDKIIRAVDKAESQMNMYRRKKKNLDRAIKNSPSDESLIQQLGKLENLRDNIMRGVIGNAIDLGINV